MTDAYREWLLSPALMALLGLVVGSFLNVVIHRLPRMMLRQWWADTAAQLGDEEGHRDLFGSAPPALLQDAARHLAAADASLARLDLARPRSHCPACGHRLAWHDNIPLWSWLRLHGRCRACGTPILLRYPLVEALTAALFAALAWRHGPQWPVLAACAVAATLVALAAIDWDTLLLPDSLTLPLLWAGLGAAALGWGVSLHSAVIGAIAGYGVLWVVATLFERLTGKTGMGAGDFKLLAALGAWLGWQALLPVLLLASVSGAVVGLAMQRRGTLREGRYVPFGPFLAGAGIAVLLVGQAPMLAWLGVSGM
jgi:leader peptidase (prepilin peptidase)/N-methyltransferase